MNFNIFLSTDLPLNIKQQYDRMLIDSVNEPHFHGSMMNPMKVRQVLVNEDEEVMGCFETATRMYEGKSYYNTNRPYLLPKWRGQGLMEQVLRDYYQLLRPAIAWINIENTASIRLFQKLGFERGPVFNTSDQQGHYYFLT